MTGIHNTDLSLRTEEGNAGTMMSYQGPDRRVHRVYLTRNTEYHLRRDVCVAVRDRESGSWVGNHAAINQKVLGALAISDNGGVKVTQGLPEVGSCICFDVQGLVTSRVEGMERPPKATVEAHYSVVA